MTPPIIASLTAGIILLLQMILMAMVFAGRGKLKQPFGDGTSEDLLRAIRRHGNLAENSGLFIVGLALLELLKLNPTWVVGLAAAFVLARLSHAVGLSMSNTMNAWRGIGGIGTLLTGVALAGLLIWRAGTALM